MTVLWIAGACVLAVLWAMSIVDILRHQHLAEAELRHDGATRPFDGTGIRP